MFKNPRIFARVELLVYLLILIAPVGMYITTARKENWVKKADVSAKETYTKLAEIPMDPLYHFDNLTACKRKPRPRSENNKKFYVFFCDKQRLLRLVL